MSAVIYPGPASTSSITPAYVNPAQMQNQHPPQSKKKLLQAAKRKRTDTPDDSTTESATPPRKARDGPKKKKANRACFHCQKAHLTCDDSRPCQRCIKRGIANNCTEGHRKKAKYLLDDDELERLKRSKSSSTSANTSEPTPAPSASSSTDPFSQNDPLLSNSFDPPFSFGSEVAGLEYSILSAILGNSSPPASETSPPPQHQPYSNWSSESVDFATSPRLSSYASSYPDAQISSLSSESALTTSPGGTPYLAYGYTQQRSEELELPYPTQYQSVGPPQPLQPRYPLDARARSPPTDSYVPGKDTIISNTGLLSPAPSNASPTSVTSVPQGIAEIAGSSRSKLQSINDRVTKPYDYTEGYHFLMKHLPTRFEKDDILRIVRALAIFRPSLIALQMPLSRDDEVFVEKCFQRTLLEMEKLMSYSGTPTVVWRRTGEICLVAPEFCMLTDWPMEELVGRKKFIYELFENQSVVEYWENFATHAFENTTQSVYSHCVLLKPNGVPVPSAFCFSVRRDLFDLPSMVIGQWLPLL